jgi:hypothetical protein
MDTLRQEQARVVSSDEAFYPHLAHGIAGMISILDHLLTATM